MSRPRPHLPAISLGLRHGARGAVVLITHLVPLAWANIR